MTPNVRSVKQEDAGAPKRLSFETAAEVNVLLSTILDCAFKEEL